MEDQANSTPAESTEQSAPQETTATDTSSSNEESRNDSADTKDLGSMNEEEQLSALKKMGVFDSTDAEPNHEADKEQKPQDKPAEHPAEPMFTVKVNGEEKQVPQSELVAGYQRQADYSRKTQELADERRRYESLIAQVAAGNTQNQQQQTQAPTKGEQVQQSYDAAVARAEDMLGIPHGEFNQFDPTHTYALNQVQMMQARESDAINHRNMAVQDFADQARRDPLTPQIENIFESMIYKLGASGEKGQQVAPYLMTAYARFQSGQATMDDLDLLKAHWDYCRQIVSAPAHSKATQAPQPPATEAPGAGQRNEPKARLSKKTLASKRGDDQFAYLKSLGIFS